MMRHYYEVVGFHALCFNALLLPLVDKELAAAHSANLHFGAFVTTLHTNVAVGYETADFQLGVATRRHDSGGARSLAAEQHVEGVQLDVACGDDGIQRLRIAHLDHRARRHGAVGQDVEFVALEFDDGGFLALGKIVGAGGDDSYARRVLAGSVDEVECPPLDNSQLADGHGESLLDAIDILLGVEEIEN